MRTRPSPLKEEFPASTYRRLFEKFILHDKLNRVAVGKILRRSPGSVTKCVRMLLDGGILLSTPVRVAHAKRPVDELALRPDGATGLCVFLTDRQATGELIGLDLKAFYRTELEIRKPTQAVVLDTLGRLVTQALGAAREFGRKVDFLGIATEGLVLPHPGLIFSMYGIPDWVPCQPASILEALAPIGRASVWTTVECKVNGFARSLREDDRLAYLEVHRDHIALSVLRNGEAILGEYGTSSAYLHTQVSDEPARCFCGRKGCFHQHLLSGRLSAEIMQAGLRNVFEQISAKKAAIEFCSDRHLPDMTRLRSSAYRLQIVADGSDFAREGLRFLTALECAFLLLNRR